MLAIMLSGCVTPRFNYHPEAKNISFPPLNTVEMAYVGDNMIKQGKVTEQDVLILNSPVDFGILKAYTLTKGFYVKAGEDKDDSFYLPSSLPGAGKIEKAAIADPFKAIEVKTGKGELCIVTVYNLSACSKADFKLDKKDIVSENGFQQSLIYNGRINNRINIGYREFSNDIARPAFSNNVEYDLNESNEIGYKGARIRILKATNQFIKYIVIKNFNHAQQ